MTFPAGMDENDNPYLNYIEERTGLEIGVNLPPPEVYNEAGCHYVLRQLAGYASYV